MKIFKVDFDGMWPVPHGLIIAAENLKEASKIAKETVKHTEVREVNEVDISQPTVIFYESGDY